MHRLAASLLCAALAFAALVAPTPVFRPRASKVWADGWDKLVVPSGDCRFAAKDDKLTATVTVDPGGGWIYSTARLLRTASGDFDIEARVSIDTGRPEGDPAIKLVAGVRIQAGKDMALAATQADIAPKNGPARVHVWGRMGLVGPPASRFYVDRVTPDTPVRLRLTRRGDSVEAAYRVGGGEWKKHDLRGTVRLPDGGKVGVFVASTGRGPAKAVFDDFKFTRPPK
jgi:hypothetical protein